uniref:Uncharacterized protein n=1 Tax=Manihot esculenta TaxID=3983 RepID=A0A2C9V7M6_MANES
MFLDMKWIYYKKRISNIYFLLHIGNLSKNFQILVSLLCIKLGNNVKLKGLLSFFTLLIVLLIAKVW